MEKIYISRKHLVKACVIALIILVGVVWQYTGKENETIEWEEASVLIETEDSKAQQKEQGTEESKLQDQPVGVHVTGAVAHPDQVYYLKQGARIEDAIQKAGGALEEADLSQLNLADYVKDGQRIYVPLLGETIEKGQNTMEENQETLLTNINLATKIELLTLPGIGETYADRIIQYREEYGAFETIEDLMKVKGIGESKFNDIKDKITVD